MSHGCSAVPCHVHPASLRMGSLQSRSSLMCGHSEDREWTHGVDSVDAFVGQCIDGLGSTTVSLQLDAASNLPHN